MMNDELQVNVEQMASIIKLTPDNISFEATQGGFIKAFFEGQDKGLVNIVRTFPLSDADRLLSVRLADGKQEEIGIIDDISDFDDNTVQLLQKHLKLRYFRPKIQKIISVKEQFGYTYWTVHTDMGLVKFASSSGSAGSVVRHKDGVIIKDSNNNRYELEDLSVLSAKELKKIDLYL